jgi:hypothetical protein
MAQKLHLWISKIDCTLFNGFPELLNANCLSPRYQFDPADAQFLLEMHLLIRNDTIILSFQHIDNAVHIMHTLGGGFSLRIG